MWCNQKFERGHACLKSQLYHFLIDESPTQEGEPDEYLDCVNNLDVGDQREGNEGYNSTISLQALHGTEGCQTIHVVGKIKKQTLVMLVDSGSTHNFIN